MAGLEKAFELAVVISAVDKFTAPARAMAAQMGLLSKQSETLQKRMKAFKAMAITGGVITGIGGAMALGLTKAVDSAGELQTAMMGVKDALKLTNAEYLKASNLAQTVGIPTVFSSIQVSDIMKSMATSGLTKQQVLDPSILRQYVNFADVQAQIKHENAPDVVSAAVNMAHQYQLYSTAQITPFLNSLNAALLHTHETASEFGTTYKYIANQARAMGMNSAQTLSATAWLGRMGFGNGRGGTNFADFLRRSIYGSSGKKADAAMVAAGFVRNGHSIFENANGQFVGIPQAVAIMQAFGRRFNNNASLMTPLLHSIFGTQGARIAMMMTSSGAAEQYVRVQQQIAGTASISQSQKDLNNTWNGKIKQLQTTLTDIGQAFGKSVMPVLLPLVKALDDILGKVLVFEQQHPKIMKMVSAFASIATAVMLVVGPLMLLTGALGFLKTSASFSAGLGLLRTSLLGMLGPLALVASAGYLLYLAWTHNWGGIQQKTAKVVAWFKKEIPPLIAMFNKFLRLIGVEYTGQQMNRAPNGKQMGWSQVTKFHMPSWAKWVAGIIVANKTLGMMFGTFNRVKKVAGAFSPLIKVFKLLSREWGVFGALFKLSGRGMLSVVRMMILVLTKFRLGQLAVIAVTKAWRLAQLAVNLVLDANPIALIILAIAALVVGIIELVKHWKTVVSWLWKAWTWFKNLGIGAQSAIALIMPIIGIPALIIAHWKPIAAFFDNIWKHIAPVVNGVKNGWHHLFGGGSNAPAIPSSTASNQTVIHVHPGAIQVNGQTDGQQLSSDFLNHLGNQARQNNLSRPFGPNRLVFGR